MRILSIRPAPPGGTDLARFDAETPEGIRLFNLSLKRGADGVCRVWAPCAFGQRVATFPASIVDTIAAAALAALRSADQYDRLAA